MWVGLWHGGSSYSAPYAQDVEYFPSLRVAGNVLWSRFTNGDMWKQTFRYVIRGTDLVYCPTVGQDSELHLYWFPVRTSPGTIVETIERDGYPDRVIRFGPRGGIRIELT